MSDLSHDIWIGGTNKARALNLESQNPFMVIASSCSAAAVLVVENPFARDVENCSKIFAISCEYSTAIGFERRRARQSSDSRTFMFLTT